MKRQNRTLGLLVVATALLLGLIWFLGSFLKEDKEAPSRQDPTAVSSGGPESMGDPVDENAGPPQDPLEGKKIFAQILGDALQCLGLHNRPIAPEPAVKADIIVNLLETDFGLPVKQMDRWMMWHLRNHDGRERRLRLEVTEQEGGGTKRELHHFAIDRQGLPIPLQLEPQQEQNPSDETINKMLREGEVFYKEQAGSDLFTGGERLDYVEANDQLSEFDLAKDSAQFHCPNLKARESCSCSKADRVDPE